MDIITALGVGVAIGCVVAAIWWRYWDTFDSQHVSVVVREAMMMTGVLTSGCLPTTNESSDAEAILRYYPRNCVYARSVWLARQLARIYSIPDEALPTFVLRVDPWAIQSRREPISEFNGTAMRDADVDSGRLPMEEVK